MAGGQLEQLRDILQTVTMKNEERGGRRGREEEGMEGEGREGRGEKQEEEEERTGW